MPMSSDRWRSTYESFAFFFVNGGGFYTFFGGVVLLVIAANVTKAHSILGITFGRIGMIWFLAFVALFLIGRFLGWNDIADRNRLEDKLKPVERDSSIPMSSNRRRSTYESFAIFMESGAAFPIFLGGMISLAVAHKVTRNGSIFGISIVRIIAVWFVTFVGLILIGGFLGWDEIADRKRLEGKLKPIPARGKKIELYEINTGKALGHISERELKYLIDSFTELGMEGNDFYILRETVDLLEERGADRHLVATLREMMGDKNDMEIGWTRV